MIHGILTKNHLANKDAADRDSFVGDVVNKQRKRVLENVKQLTQLLPLVHLAETARDEVQRGLVDIRKVVDEIGYHVKLEKQRETTPTICTLCGFLIVSKRVINRRPSVSKTSMARRWSLERSYRS